MNYLVVKNTVAHSKILLHTQYAIDSLPHKHAIYILSFIVNTKPVPTKSTFWLVEGKCLSHSGQAA